MHTKPMLANDARPTTTGIVERPDHLRRDPITIPLTTTFTPPAECFNGIVTDGGLGVSYDLNDVGVYTSKSSYGFTCYPLSFNSVEYYSPGFCPSGWTQALEISSTGSIYPSVVKGEHAA